MLQPLLRVVVADDHPDIVKAICRSLMLDCDVVGRVADGRALLEAVRQLQPDVVVVDVNLPQVHGLEACRRITAAHPKTRVIMFTAMNDPDVRERSFEYGASAFVCKTNIDGLRAAIVRLAGELTSPPFQGS